MAGGSARVAESGGVGARTGGCFGWWGAWTAGM